MFDPLTEVVSFLDPQAVFSRIISGSGQWGVRYDHFGHPSFCAVLEGSCRLVVDGQAPAILEAGDFVLLPATPGFTMTGLEPGAPERMDPQQTTATVDEIRHGSQDGPVDMRMLGGYFRFGAPDSALLVTLLPTVIHARRVERLQLLVQLVNEEFRQERSGRSFVLARLVEVMMIEALRTTAGGSAPPGLVRGLADERISRALRAIHRDPSRAWTARDLAREAALSRSAFFTQFQHAVGKTPADYLFSWRMALAKRLLRERELSLDQVAERVGYASASAFSAAFSRSAGIAPGRFGRC